MLLKKETHFPVYFINTFPEVFHKYYPMMNYQRHINQIETFDPAKIYP